MNHIGHFSIRGENRASSGEKMTGEEVKVAAKKVAIVFAADPGNSMTPCFRKLRDDLHRFVALLEQFGQVLRKIALYAFFPAGNFVTLSKR